MKAYPRKLNSIFFRSRIPGFFCQFFAIVLTMLVGFGVLLGVGVGLASAQENDAFHAAPVQLSENTYLIAPHENSVVVVSRLWLILKGDVPEETLHNGKPVRWDTHFADGTHVGILRLDLGMQNLKIGDREFQFVLGRNEKDHAGPSDWLVYRLHNMKPGPNPCMRCHESKRQEDGKVKIGALMKPDDACFKCHIGEKIDVQHSNTVLKEDWKEKCSECHFIHASPHKYLLRQPRETYLKDPSIKEAPKK